MENLRRADLREDRAGREQAFVSQRTVAVAFLNGELLIAANGLWNDDVEDLGTTMQRVIDALNQSGIRGRIRFVHNPIGYGDRSFHAEMQLVRYIRQYTRRGPDDRVIGVSKPCCRRCAVNLDRSRIRYSYWHNEPTGRDYVEP